MEKFAEYYNRVLDGIIALGSKPVVINLIPVYGKRYFDWFSRKLDPKALMRFLGSTESIEHWNEMYNLAVMRIAARRGTQVECGRGIDWRHSGTAVIQRLVAGVDGLRSEINVH